MSNNDDPPNKANTVSKIKEKLSIISANITKNLLASQQNIQRSYLINERDFLGICQLALHSIHNKEKQQPTITTEQNSKELEIEKKKEEKKEEGREEEEGSKETEEEKEEEEEEDNMKTTMKASGSRSNDDDQHSKIELEESKKLKKEILKILDAQNYNSESKSSLLNDCFQRYLKNINLRKQNEIETKYSKKYPNVLMGGSKESQNSDHSDSEMTSGGEDSNNSEKNPKQHKQQQQQQQH